VLEECSSLPGLGTGPGLLASSSVLRRCFASFESFHLRLISGVIFFPRNESGPPRHILVKLFLVKPRMEVIEKRSLSVSAAVKERSQGEIGQKSCGDEGNGDGEKLRVGQV
jgi:hypothetical protein